MKEYLLSVITPAKGDCLGINDTSRSILGQSIPIEWIIIKPKNHEVTDVSLSVLPSDPRIRIVQEDSSGIYSAMNQGLALAKGKYVAFFGVGDYWISINAALHMTTKLDREKREWGFGSWFFLNVDDSLICPPLDSPITINDIFKTSTPLCHQTVVASKRILNKTGGFDTSLTVAADRLSIRKLWEESTPTTWDFPTVAYKTGGFSAVNQSRALEELAELDARFSAQKLSSFSLRNKIKVLAARVRPSKDLTSQPNKRNDVPELFDWMPESVKQ